MSIWSFLRDEGGQDIVEYTLLVAFVAFTTALLTHGFTNSVEGITGVTNSNLGAAASASR